MVLAQGTVRYRGRNATFGPEPCVARALMQGSLHYRRHNATFSPEPCFILVNAARVLTNPASRPMANGATDAKPLPWRWYRSPAIAVPYRTAWPRPTNPVSASPARSNGSLSPGPPDFPRPDVPCESQWPFHRARGTANFPVVMFQRSPCGGRVTQPSASGWNVAKSAP